jgi:copper(I)-binding protein
MSMTLPRLLTLLSSLLLAATVSAHSFTLGALELGHPWSRAMPEASPTGAAYLSIKNTGKQADTLLSASTPRADKAELHVHLNDNGVMRMREVSGGVAVAAAASEICPRWLSHHADGPEAAAQGGRPFPADAEICQVRQHHRGRAG